MLSHGRLVSFILVLLVASLDAFPISAVDSAEPLATNTTDTLSVGWVPSSPTRGTVDIIWTCTITMFLCSWSVQCMQIPGKDDSRFDIIWRRCWLTALCALGPEFTFQLALGEWASARQSVKDFHASGLSHWSMKHAFFADSGGFFLCTPDFKPIPIDAKQLLYLVNHKYIECPMLSKKTIDDKNKMDVLLRFLTMAQTIWFIATVIARHEQGLVVTGMEVTTAAFILCSFGTTFCWWHKGADVVMPEMLTTTVTMVDILKNAGSDWAGPYHRTPLDFISRVEWHWSLYWKHWINILRKMHIVFAPAALPHDRFENTIWREVKGRLLTVFIIVSLAYSAVFVTLWNSHFPTSAERLLWRLSSLVMLSTVILYFAVTAFAYVTYPALRRYFQLRRKPHRIEGIGSSADHSSKTVLDQVLVAQGMFAKRPKHRSRLSRIAMRIRNNDVSKDPLLDVPLTATLPMYIVGVLYCSSRTLILILDIVQLRSLPSNAFTTVEWSAFIPHIS